MYIQNKGKLLFFLLILEGISVCILLLTGVIKINSDKSKSSNGGQSPTSTNGGTPSGPGPGPAPTSPPQPPTSLCDPCKIQTGYFDTVGNSYTFYPTEAACTKSGRNKCQKITVTTDDKHSCCKGDPAYRYMLYHPETKQFPSWQDSAFVNKDDCLKAYNIETVTIDPDHKCLGSKDPKQRWHF